MESDSLSKLLRESKPPEPGTILDARVRAGWRELHPPLWRRMLTARVSVPAPLLAVLALLLAVVWWMEFRRTPPQQSSEPSRFVTSLDAAGFRPLPNGEARVIEVKETP